MKFSELAELCQTREDCKEHCPLFGECCNGGVGVTCYGGDPIFPPCSELDGNKDAGEWLTEHYLWVSAYEAQADQELRLEILRKQKLEKAAAKRREYQWRNKSELTEIKQCQKAIKEYKGIKSFAEATNAVNSMFRSANLPCPQDTNFSAIDLKIEGLEEKIIILKQTIENNEKIFKLGKSK